ncbi:MAG: helix-hairpin-helix domain-containing protein [Deltaproteobacteria bacterium]|nr:helix-hairpin-helix domain-containing protein [Candidatus Zymogenaceae bacterium]
MSARERRLGKRSERTESDTDKKGTRPPDRPLDRAALYIKHDRSRPPEAHEAAGLIRYRVGVIFLLSILLIGISILTVKDTICNFRSPVRSAGVVVRSPEGDLEIYPEGATIAEALDRWGIDTKDLTEETLAAPLPTGCAVTVTGNPDAPVKCEPFCARDLFVLGIPFDINTASADDLCLIPGIGERLSRRIVAHREEHGPFLCARDLTDVPGIGEKKSETIMKYVVFHDVLYGTEGVR